MKKVFVTTSWDDGHKLDVRLVDLLNKYGVKGTFYISPDDREIKKEDLLTEQQIQVISESMEIGAHTIHHNRLPELPDEEAYKEIKDSKEYLEKVTNKPVTSFCYPCGDYRHKHVEMVKEAGFSYARTIQRHTFNTKDLYESTTTLHAYNHISDIWEILVFSNFNLSKFFTYFRNWDKLAIAMFDRTLKKGGVFHLWGHSWEIDQNYDWDRLENVLKYIANKEEVQYVTNREISLIEKEVPKKLLMVSPYFPPHLGGTQFYVYNIARELRDKYGWEVVIATSGSRGFYAHDETEYKGFKVYKLPFWFKLSNTPFNPLWLFNLKKIIKDESISIINAHTPVPGIADVAAQANRKIPFILTYHGGSLHKGRPFLDFFISLYEKGPLRLLLNHADKIVCTSNFVRFEFLSRYLSKSVTITPGVDVDVFKPVESNDNRSVKNIIFVASLTKAEKYKGLDVLIDAAHQLKQKEVKLTVTVVGDGNMRQSYEQMVKDLDLEDIFSFKGRMSGPELARQYQNADIFTLPSSNEAFGMVIVEAMASQLPVVATNVGGIPSLVKDKENGFLVEPNNSAMLAEKLYLLLQDQSLCKKFGEVGRIRAVENFGWNIRASKYNDIYIAKELHNETSLPHVMIVTPYFPPSTGGVENYTYNIGRQIKKNKNFKVTIVTTNTNATYKQEVVDGVTVHRLPVWFKLFNTPINPMWFWWIRRIYAQEKPDVINGHIPVPIMADIAERVRGSIPFVLTYHNDLTKDAPITSFLAKTINFFIAKKTLRRADRIIATSDYYIDYSSYLQPYKKDVQVVSPGVDSERFNPLISGDSIKSKYDNKDIILFVGSINKAQRHKGLDDLIHSFAIISKQKRDIELVVVGGGNAKSMYTKIAEEAGVSEHIHFVGYVPEENLPEYYAAATMLVLPSTNMSEGFGMVLIEAGAVGKPVIGTKVGGIPYAVEDNKTGLLVVPKNPEVLARAMESILDNKEFAEQLGKNAVTRAIESFDWNKLALKTEKILVDAMKPRIIQVAGYYPPHLGGMEKVAQALSENLARDGYIVDVLTSSVDQKSGVIEEIPNLSIHRYKAIEFAHTPFTFGSISKLLMAPKRSIMHLHLAQAFYPELVMFISRLRKIPYVLHFHLDLIPSGSLGKLFMIYKKYVLSRVIKNADRIVVFTPEQRDFIINTYQVPEYRVAIIPNGVGEEFFISGEKSKPHNPMRLLYVGRLSAQKRVERLIETMSLVTRLAHLTIVGDGEDRITLEAQSKKLSLSNVTFVGKKQGEELREYYKNADVFIISSDREGMPLVVLEGMAAALPIIGSDVVGTHELVVNTGILVPEPYPEGFAKNIDRLVNDSELFMRLSKQSLHKAQQFTWTELVNKFELLYKELLS